MTALLLASLAQNVKNVIVLWKESANPKRIIRYLQPGSFEYSDHTRFNLGLGYFGCFLIPRVIWSLTTRFQTLARS